MTPYHSKLLLIFVLILVFAPAAENWVRHSPADWYRPYLLWAAGIAITALLTYGHRSDDV